MNDEVKEYTVTYFDLVDRVSRLEETVSRLLGIVGVLSNADKYNSELLRATRVYAKESYDFLITQDVFHDWNNARQLIKEINDEAVN